jgi:hypothetical protein
LVAILYSQVRSEARSAVYPPKACQAASRTAGDGLVYVTYEIVSGG